jgi:hypothetical protein
LQVFFSHKTRSEKLCAAERRAVSDKGLNPVCCAWAAGRQLDERGLRVRAQQSRTG